MHLTVLVLLSLHSTFNLINLSETLPVANCNTNEDSDIEGYYWRDYKGTIPKDALPVGKRLDGKDTYIGQILHQNLLIPAKIDPEEGKVTYEWGYVEYEAHENIKILCTKTPEDFEWVNTGNRHINTIKDKDFVVAGYEPGIIMLIGRKLIDGELLVGKVVFSKTQSTLNTTKDGKGTQHGTFEVLAYKPGLRPKPSSRVCKPSKAVVIYFYN